MIKQVQDERMLECPNLVLCSTHVCILRCALILVLLDMNLMCKNDHHFSLIMAIT